MAQVDARAHEGAAESSKSRAQRRWKEAALKETQRVRVERLREKQAQDARDAERKHTVSAKLERELHEKLGSRSWEEVLSHFGAASYKQALVQFHPDRAPAGAHFEEIVRREVVFKYVRMRYDRVRLAGGDAVPRRQPQSQPDDESRRRQRDEEAQAWQTQQERQAAERTQAQKQAAAEEAERRRNAVPNGAVLRVTGASWSGFGPPPSAGPLGYYAVESHGETDGRPMYRKIPPVSRADWAPWAQQAAQDALEQADQIWWQGFWRLGHRAEQRVTYMAACADDRPPTDEWDVVDSRATPPCFTWL